MNRYVVITVLVAFALVCLAKEDGYSQELSAGLNLALYNQNDNLADGGGYEAFVNFKINKYPIVLRLMFCQFIALPIPYPLPLTDKETMGYSFEPALLLRFDFGTRPDFGPVFQPYVGIAYGFHGFPETINFVDTLVVRESKIQDTKSPVFIFGTNVTFTPRLSLNLNCRYSMIKPDVEHKFHYRDTGNIVKKMEKLDDGLKTLYFSIGIRFHIFKNPRFR